MVRRRLKGAKTRRPTPRVPDRVLGAIRHKSQIPPFTARVGLPLIPRLVPTRVRTRPHAADAE